MLPNINIFRSSSFNEYILMKYVTNITVFTHNLQLHFNLYDVVYKE